MPDESGRIRPISVPAVPWHEEPSDEFVEAEIVTTAGPDATFRDFEGRQGAWSWFDGIIKTGES